MNVIIDGQNYIPDPRRTPFRAFLVIGLDRGPDAFSVEQANLRGVGPNVEQFIVQRDEFGNLSVRPA